MRGLVTFLAVYLSVYGGAHLYAFVKLKNGLTLNTWVSAGLAVFMSVMVLTPILMRVAERHGYELVARSMAYIGFIWMGLLTRLFYKTHPGLTPLQKGSSAYVSRGSGTWGPPVRFLSPPEVTLIEIVRRP